MNKKLLIILFSFILLWWIFFFMKRNKIHQINKKNIITHTMEKTHKFTNTKTISSDSIKQNINDKKKINNNWSTLEKNEIEVAVNNLYLNPWTDLFEKEANLSLELYKKFSKRTFLKYVFIALIRWDYNSIKKLKQYYLIKFGKNILNWYKKYTYIIKLNKKVDSLKVNWKEIKSDGDKFIYETYFPFNFNIIIYKKWCVPMLRKKIWYISDKKINIKFTCIRMKKITCNDKVWKIKIWKLVADLSNICWNNNIKEVDYAYLNEINAKVLWYLDLPVFGEYWYKLLAQWFDTYWMPIIILKNDKGNIVNNCVPIFYKYKSKKNKYLSVNKYFGAVYWQKKWYPWWWNLDLSRWIWYAGYQQIYDKTNNTFLAKYCYKF